MNYNQNKKIKSLQITSETLIIGVDIAKLTCSQSSRL